MSWLPCFGSATYRHRMRLHKLFDYPYEAMGLVLILVGLCLPELYTFYVVCPIPPGSLQRRHT